MATINGLVALLLFTIVTAAAVVTANIDDEDWYRGSSLDHTDRGGDLNIPTPTAARRGDTFFLFISRSDDLLPIVLDGWTLRAACFKSRNGQRSCHQVSECVERRGDYCRRFSGDNRGRDLATVVFSRQVERDEPDEIRFEITGTHRTWAILVAIEGAQQDAPVRDVAMVSCDRDRDSVFPSVNGQANDVVLLSQGFDDRVSSVNAFGPPQGTDLIEWTNGADEAGFLFGKRLTEAGTTGALETIGAGGADCKDVLISLVVARGDGDINNDVELRGSQHLMAHNPASLQPITLDDGGVSGTDKSSATALLQQLMMPYWAALFVSHLALVLACFY